MFVRLSKAVMVLGLAAFALLVTYNNLFDYEANYQFVRHVLSMDTTFEGNAAMGRAITDPRLWQAGYWAIIVGEGLTGLLLLLGGLRLLQKSGARLDDFHAAKTLTMAGAVLAFLVWFVGFMVIGGEWFLMWQSETWNGQQAAFRFYVSILLVTILVLQPDTELKKHKNVRRKSRLLD
ncbi:MAG: DUF2165 domain-containing protein [Pseudomonadota bacterium]